MVISCEIVEITLEGDYTEIDSVEATCSHCLHTTESYGRLRTRSRDVLP